MHSTFVDRQVGAKVGRHAEPVLSPATSAAAWIARPHGAAFGWPRAANPVANPVLPGSAATPFAIDDPVDDQPTLDLHDEAGAEGETDGPERSAEPRSEDDIVLLHWRLLQEIQHLADPATPLEEKLDTLRWVFTERERDTLPFSFVNCLRVVG